MTRVFSLVALALASGGALVGCASAARAPERREVPAAIGAPLGLPGLEDGRARFREIYCAVRAGGTPSGGAGCDGELLRLPDEAPASPARVDLVKARLRLRVLVVPGLYGDCIPVGAFSDALPRLREMGHETGVIDVHGFSSIAANAARIRAALAALDSAGEPVVLVGFSKGVADVLEALVAYPEVRGRVSAVVSVAGVVGGSPLAEHYATHPLLAPMTRLASLACRERERGVLTELGRPARTRWLAANELPASVRYYSLAACDTREGISRALRGGYDLLARTDPRNDGALIVSDAIIPGSKLLGIARADHLAVGLPLSHGLPGAAALGFDRNDFPRAELLEAVVRTVEEDLLASRSV